ncbi:zinc finger CCCH domain-containing protein 1 [Nicotiana tabacum]|uniref:Zinc finger CCCH domain-containing protein 1 n=1 Tax=Nicotiana tabacum TaxID=4097 RepID=A0A1S4CMV0_TOBAC|nr:zinc finger CCCH domain-containing protein 1-like [Nicotiana tomentosiformis]XP_016502602.1 PREDICTED: zinc finger CCCH domain-containing protein 1-like [Nicotiana tabacum]
MENSNTPAFESNPAEAETEQPPTAPPSSSSVCNFFKKPSKGKNIRKRPTVVEGESDDAEGESSVIYTKKKPAIADNKLRFSTGASKCNKATESNVDSKAPVFHFESSKEIQVQNDSRATATLETETEFSKDARAIRERALKQAEEALKGKSKTGGDEKLYKGMNQYTDYKAGLRREHTISSEKAGGAHGPLRASAHIRVSARFDYQPDICKDYKETGYCGYGDSCKFMHDRGDYKSGWQIEKEWDEAEKERKRKLAMGMLDEDDEDAEKSDEDDDDALPFACFICREPFVDPVVTKCKHYFCEHCALKHHAKNKKCFVCNQPTLGIFNTAFEIRKRMAAQGK